MDAVEDCCNVPHYEEVCTKDNKMRLTADKAAKRFDLMRAGVGSPP